MIWCSKSRHTNSCFPATHGKRTSVRYRLPLIIFDLCIFENGASKRSSLARALGLVSIISAATVLVHPLSRTHARWQAEPYMCEYMHCLCNRCVRLVLQTALWSPITHELQHATADALRLNSAALRHDRNRAECNPTLGPPPITNHKLESRCLTKPTFEARRLGDVCPW